MNLFQEIKAFLAAKSALKNIEEAQLKSGWKTSEFWVTVATNVITIAGALKGIIPENTAAIIIAVANAVYTIARTLTKAATAVAAPAPMPAK